MRRNQKCLNDNKYELVLKEKISLEAIEAEQAALWVNSTDAGDSGIIGQRVRAAHVDLASVEHVDAAVLADAAFLSAADTGADRNKTSLS